MTATKSFQDPRTLLKRYGLYAKKSWGQNFLVSERAVSKIADLCVDKPARKIIEIGAGLGTLTQTLLLRGGNVIAIERDKDMCEVLVSEFSENKHFKLIEADAATFDYAECMGNQPGIVAGNLPYQITGRILRRVLETEMPLLKAVFMVQEEVANRLVATPGEKARGALSVMTDGRCKVKIVLRLSPTAFVPRPKVRSAVVEFVPRETPMFKGLKQEFFDKTVKAAFSSRRKTIRNSLIASGYCSAAEAEKILNSSDINPGERAERLATMDFVKLAQAKDKYNSL